MNEIIDLKVKHRYVVWLLMHKQIDLKTAEMDTVIHLGKKINYNILIVIMILEYESYCV